MLDSVVRWPRTRPPHEPRRGPLRYHRKATPRDAGERTPEGDAWTMRLAGMAQAALANATVEDRRARASIPGSGERAGTRGYDDALRRNDNAGTAPWRTEKCHQAGRVDRPPRATTPERAREQQTNDDNEPVGSRRDLRAEAQNSWRVA